MEKKKGFLTTIFIALILISVFSTPGFSAARRPKGDSASRGEVTALRVKIVEVQVMDLDRDGVEDDVKILGKVALKSDSDGEYRVSLLMKLRYIGQDPQHPKKFSRGDLTIAKQSMKMDAEEGEWSTGRFTFKFYNKGGWYKARAWAKSGGLLAKSRTVIFDPPGGSRGPMK